MKTRTLVIGDIHGGYRALEQVLYRADIGVEDTIVFLGDYVDGWSESQKVIDSLINLGKRQKCIFLKGNHDELCLKWLKTQTPNDLWEKHGGASTKKAYLEMSDREKKRHIDFFEHLANYHIDSQDRLFVHGGFTNTGGIDKEHFNVMYYWDRTLWEVALSLDPNLPKGHPHYPRRLLHYDEIFIGHTPTTRIGVTVPTNAANVWNIDTGAAFTGPLTALDIDSKNYWQSDPLTTLYPEERGRN